LLHLLSIYIFNLFLGICIFIYVFTLLPYLFLLCFMISRLTSHKLSPWFLLDDLQLLCQFFLPCINTVYLGD
jgi:hypothetical protein